MDDLTICCLRRETDRQRKEEEEERTGKVKEKEFGKRKGEKRRGTEVLLTVFWKNASRPAKGQRTLWTCFRADDGLCFMFHGRLPLTTIDLGLKFVSFL